MNLPSLQAETYTSASEIIHSAKAIRERLLRPANAYRPPVASPEPPKPQIKRKPRKEVQHDAHVIDWQAKKEAYDAIEVDARKISCRDYIKRRCDELGLSHAEVTGPSRVRHIVDARQLLMFEIKTQVKPSISFQELGKLFGGRDHTTCLHACMKHGYEGTGGNKSERDDIQKIKELHAAGLSQAAIAEQVGCSPSTVRRYSQEVRQSAYEAKLAKKRLAARKHYAEARRKARAAE